MHLLSKYPTNPWLGFNAIRKKHGDVVSLKLGQVKAVLISSPEVMREVLLLKGDIFCDRPSFHRYALIFGRDRNNCKSYKSSNFVNLLNKLSVCVWGQLWHFAIGLSCKKWEDLWLSRESYQSMALKAINSSRIASNLKSILWLKNCESKMRRF